MSCAGALSSTPESSPSGQTVDQLAVQKNLVPGAELFQGIGLAAHIPGTMHPAVPEQHDPLPFGKTTFGLGLHMFLIFFTCEHV